MSALDPDYTISVFDVATGETVVRSLTAEEIADLPSMIVLPEADDGTF